MEFTETYVFSESISILVILFLHEYELQFLVQLAFTISRRTVSLDTLNISQII